jgi:hypothetical protein
VPECSNSELLARHVGRHGGHAPQLNVRGTMGFGVEKFASALIQLRLPQVDA